MIVGILYRSDGAPKACEASVQKGGVIPMAEEEEEEEATLGPSVWSRMHRYTRLSKWESARPSLGVLAQAVRTLGRVSLLLLGQGLAAGGLVLANGLVRGMHVPEPGLTARWSELLEQMAWVALGVSGLLTVLVGCVWAMSLVGMAVWAEAVLLRRSVTQAFHGALDGSPLNPTRAQEVGDG